VTPFAQELNAAMSAAGLNASELADRSGLTEAAISYLRSGQREPSYRSLQRLTQVLPELNTLSALRPSIRSRTQ